MAPDDSETVANMQAYIESRLAAIRDQGSGGGNQAGSSGQQIDSSSGSESSGGSVGQEPVGLVERILVSWASLGSY